MRTRQPIYTCSAGCWKKYREYLPELETVFHEIPGHLVQGTEG